jgi:hypothetical protein
LVVQWESQVLQVSLVRKVHKAYRALKEHREQPALKELQAQAVLLE